MANIILKTVNLCKTFSVGGRQQHVLKNLNLEIEDGDLTVIMGNSGSGKSTLLYCLSGMDKASMGEISYGDERIEGYDNDRLAVFRRQNCGFVFQEVMLNDNMSILDNVLCSGYLGGAKATVGGKVAVAESVVVAAEMPKGDENAEEMPNGNEPAAEPSNGTATLTTEENEAAEETPNDNETAVTKKKSWTTKAKETVAEWFIRSERKKVAERAKELLREVGIAEEMFKKFPQQMSGGELQRVGLVRAMINDPKVVFADEPTGALNSANSGIVLSLFNRFNDLGKTVVMVTHDLRTASHGKRILYLKDGVILNELQLGVYREEEEKERINRLKTFLDEMGW